MNNGVVEPLNDVILRILQELLRRAKRKERKSQRSRVAGLEEEEEETLSPDMLERKQAIQAGWNATTEFARSTRPQEHYFTIPEIRSYPPHYDWKIVADSDDAWRCDCPYWQHDYAGEGLGE